MKLHRLLPGLLAMGFGLVSANAAFGDIIDQSQLLNTVNMAEFSQTDLAQSFQQSANNITGADIQLEAGVGDGKAGDITISLYDALPNAGGNLLVSGTATGVLAGQFATVNWGTVSVTPNTTYYLVFTSTDNSLGISGDTGNPYPRGQVYANPGFSPFAAFDYTFQTFATSSGAVPEPASATLFAVGGCVVLTVARLRSRRRRATF